MDIKLTQRAEELIHRHLAAGAYTSPVDVIERALDLLDAPMPTMESLEEKLNQGLDDLANGQSVDLNRADEIDEFFDDLMRRGDARLSAQRDPA